MIVVVAFAATVIGRLTSLRASDPVLARHLLRCDLEALRVDLAVIHVRPKLLAFLLIL